MSRVGLGVLGARIASVFPEATPVLPVKLLGEGFDSTAVETASGMVFRVGRAQTSAAGYAIEAGILPALVRHTALVPEIKWFKANDDRFPFGIIGHEKIQGRGLSPKDLDDRQLGSLALQTGAFLRTLHAFPRDEARALGVPEEDMSPKAMSALRDLVTPALHQGLDTSEQAVVSAWWSELISDRGFYDFEPALIHGDLWYGNCLVEDGRLVGVIDFGDASIGDPAQDYATLWHTGRSFMERALGGLANAHMRHRITRRWALREFSGLRTALLRDDDEALRDSLAKLRRGPILSGRR